MLKRLESLRKDKDCELVESRKKWNTGYRSCLSGVGYNDRKASYEDSDSDPSYARGDKYGFKLLARTKFTQNKQFKVVQIRLCFRDIQYSTSLTYNIRLSPDIIWKKKVNY